MYPDPLSSSTTVNTVGYVYCGKGETELTPLIDERHDEDGKGAESVAMEYVPRERSGSRTLRDRGERERERERVDSYDHVSWSSSDGKYRTWTRRKSSRAGRAGKNRRVSMFGMQVTNGWKRLEGEDNQNERNRQSDTTVARRVKSAVKNVVTFGAYGRDESEQVEGMGKKVKRWFKRAGQEWLDTAGYMAQREGTTSWMIY